MNVEDMVIEFCNSESYHLYKKLPDRTIDWRFEPFAIVLGKLSDQATEAKLRLLLSSAEGDTLFDGQLTVRVQDREFSGKFLLGGKLLEPPNEARVTVETTSMVKNVSKKLPWVQLSGRVEDFDGAPLSGAIVCLGKRIGWTEKFDGGLVTTGEDGSYEFYVSEGLYRKNWAITEDILTDTLENYFFELSLEEDTVLDFRIDQLEVAYLAVTPVDDDRMFAMRFIFWKINTSCLPFYEAVARGESVDLSDPRFIPRLKRDEVEVLVDGVPVEIIAFESVPVQNGPRSLTPGWYIEAVLPSAIERGKHSLIVVIHHKGKDRQGNEVMEHGQAQYFNLMFP